MLTKKYHFIGIGGIGMSALARILLEKGAKVTGSDLSSSALTEELSHLGAKIYLGHKKRYIGSADIVVYSSGVPEDNCERVAAKEKKRTILHRSQLLREVMKGGAPILITGTHGKTTTSSLLSHLMVQGGLDPSFAIGGKYLGSKSSRVGKGIYFIAEADESDGTFLNYNSFGAIVTNLELDHMEFWKEEKYLHAAFKKFSDSVGSKKHLFWCYDDPALRSLKLKGFSYGFDEKSDLVIENFRQEGWNVIFDFTFHGKHYREVDFPLIGGHNVLNAAATCGMAIQLDIPEGVIRRGLKSFPGVGRRLEKKGEELGIAVFDDYAHHPTEIFSTLRALKTAAKERRIVAVFQPHRACRTQFCLADFPDAFEYADAVIVTDIFKTEGETASLVSAKEVVSCMHREGACSAQYVSRANLNTFLPTFVEKGDLIVTLGAGDITQVGPSLLDHLEKKKG